MTVGVLALSVFAAGGSAYAANYPLEITNIRPGLSPNNRLSRAYPGLEYRIRVAVIGGAYPFAYSLANAPSGMVIDPITGEVIWANPTGTVNPTVTVTDAEGTRVSASWSITVTTAGFKFVDAVNGRNAQGNGCTSSCGTGAANSPWRTLSDVYHAGAVGDFVYFRSGTYRQLDLPREGIGGAWERVSWSEDRDPVVWMAYPGAIPLIDFGYVEGSENAPLIRFSGNNVYVEGFETRNSRHIAFQYGTDGGTGPTFRRMRMSGLVGRDGTNSSFIMTTTSLSLANYMVIQDCEFSNVDGIGVTLKIYAQHKLLIENTVHHDAMYAIELKEDVRRFTVRGNRVFNVQTTGIGGNMHEVGTHGEIMFNNVQAGRALDLNQNGMAGVIQVYRNTFVGRVQVRNTDSADGPFYIYNNVIVNSDSGTPAGSHVYQDNVTAPSRVIISNNLAGYPADNIVDATGNLTPAYAGYLGVVGHFTQGTGTTLPLPAPPANLRVIR